MAFCYPSSDTPFPELYPILNLVGYYPLQGPFFSACLTLPFLEWPASVPQEHGGSQATGIVWTSEGIFGRLLLGRVELWEKSTYFPSFIISAPSCL